MCLWATFLVPILSLISANVKHIFREPSKILFPSGLFSDSLSCPQVQSIFLAPPLPFLYLDGSQTVRSFASTSPKPFIP
jgi:hypothetical protein